MENWRVIDTGLRPAAQNVALNRALLEARAADESSSTLRFLRFTPSALLGYHQSAGQELNLDFCADHGVEVQRRITGGGAAYLDEAQIGWELYLHKRDAGVTDMQAISKRICHAAATAVSALGVDARYRPRGEIEVDGRRLASAAGAFDGDALMFQGTLQLDIDIGKMLHVLRLPAEHVSDKAMAAARERVTSLQELLGRAPDAVQIKRNFVEAFESEFDIEFSEGDLSLTENQRFRAALEEIDALDWVHLVARPAGDLPLLEAERQFAGGSLRAGVAYDRVARCVRQAWFTGDILMQPRRALPDLEAALRDAPADRIETRVREFFSSRTVEMPALTSADFISVMQLALGEALTARSP